MGVCLWIACFLVFYVEFSSAAWEIEVPLGFPASIACRYGYAQIARSQKPRNGHMVTCVITKNGTIVYNGTGIWRKIKFKGIFFDVTEDTLQTQFNVKLNWSASSNSGDVKIRSEALDSECRTTEARDMTLYKGESGHRLGCHYDKIISVEQFYELHCECYKNCVKLTDGYGEMMNYRGAGVDADIGWIELNDISYEQTPGIYRCAMTYKNRTYFYKKPIRVCVASKPTSFDLPALLPGQTHYNAVPGQNLTVKCISKGRESTNYVVWHKLQKGKVEDGKSCTATDEQELKKRMNADFGDLVATYSFRNLTKSDSGTYSCTLINKGHYARANFNITVQDPIA